MCVQKYNENFNGFMLTIGLPMTCHMCMCIAIVQYNITIKVVLIYKHALSLSLYTLRR